MIITIVIMYNHTHFLVQIILLFPSKYHTIKSKTQEFLLQLLMTEKCNKSINEPKTRVQNEIYYLSLSYHNSTNQLKYFFNNCYIYHFKCYLNCFTSKI